MAKTTQNKYGIILRPRLIFLPFERICDQSFFDGQPSNLRARSKCLRKRQVKSNFYAASNLVIYGKKKGRRERHWIAHLLIALLFFLRTLKCEWNTWCRFLTHQPVCVNFTSYFYSLQKCARGVSDSTMEWISLFKAFIFSPPYKSRRMSLFFSLIMGRYARAHSEIWKEMFSRVRPHDQNCGDTTVM